MFGNALKCSLMILIGLALPGCRSVGPQTIPRDQFDYAESMRDASKEQMLLNMVGLRYAEAPMFLKVTSVINQYSLEGAVSAAAPPYQQQAAAAPPVGVAGRYADVLRSSHPLYCMHPSRCPSEFCQPGP